MRPSFEAMLRRHPALLRDAIAWRRDALPEACSETRPQILAGLRELLALAADAGSVAA